MRTEVRKCFPKVTTAHTRKAMPVHIITTADQNSGCAGRAIRAEGHKCGAMNAVVMPAVISTMIAMKLPRSFFSPEAARRSRLKIHISIAHQAK